MRRILIKYATGLVFQFKFGMSFLANEGRYNVVNINDEWKRYSEMVPFSKWDDLVYIGTAKQGATEGKQFAVYMREKRAKSLLH
ncbi:hypothetical protein QCI75_29715 [Bacillus cereus group sp. RP43]